MPNHVHLILVPSDPDGLRRALARVHRSYAGAIQSRRKRTGHFWQGRFGAAAMDEEHLAAALRYVSLNPVRARLVQTVPLSRKRITLPLRRVEGGGCRGTTQWSASHRAGRHRAGPFLRNAAL